MALLIMIPGRDTSKLIRNLQAAAPDIELLHWPAVSESNRPCFALVWQPEPGALAKFSGLLGISSFGAGVDNILSDPTRPQVPVCRIVDADLATQMARYVAHEVLHQQLRMPLFVELQAHSRWKPRSPRRARSVAILGLGELGGRVASVLQSMAFDVSGWSRTQKQLPGIRCYAGEAGLAQMLAGADFLVNLLPLTADTSGLLDQRLFDLCKPGCYLINVARGEHLVEADLLSALARGQLAGASLDVFQQEPLPPEHPFWSHASVRISPHCAAVTNQQTVVTQVIENYHRAMAGEPLLHQIDPQLGY